MTHIKSTLLAATLLAGGIGGLAYAQQATPTPPAPQPPASQAATYDPSQLPAVQGKVAEYSLTPRGDVDGLILQDGTQVHFSPRMSTALVYTVRPGDSVTVHGLKAKALPIMLGMSITNDATHQTVTDMGPQGPRMEPGVPSEITGQVKAPLYGPRGEINGVLMADGTEIRLPPPEAAKLGDTLTAGKALVVRGDAVDSPLGKVVLARAIGPDAADLTQIAMPHPGGPGHEHGWKHGRGPHGPGPLGGPDGAPPPPPPPAQ